MCLNSQLETFNFSFERPQTTGSSGEETRSDLIPYTELLFWESFLKRLKAEL